MLSISARSAPKMKGLGLLLIEIFAGIRCERGRRIIWLSRGANFRTRHAASTRICRTMGSCWRISTDKNPRCTVTSVMAREVRNCRSCRGFFFQDSIRFLKVTINQKLAYIAQFSYPWSGILKSQDQSYSANCSY